MNLTNLYNQIRMHEYIHTEQKPTQDLEIHAFAFHRRVVASVKRLHIT
jgi:hypothetical protein